VADVFISYKRERIDAAKHLANIVQVHGFSVWFDKDPEAGLQAGATYTDEIEREIRQTKVVLALFCSRAVGSEWMRREVNLAFRLRKLLPVLLEPLAEEELPLMLQGVQLLDMVRWTGRPTGPLITNLVRDLGKLVGRPGQADAGRISAYERTWIESGKRSLMDMLVARPEDASDYVEHHASNAPRPRAPLLDQTLLPQTPPPTAQPEPEQVVSITLTSATEKVSLGRADDNDVLLSHPKVSAYHAIVRMSHGTITIEDRGSSNGTFVRGAKIEPGAPTVIEPGERVFLGPIPLLAQVVRQRRFWLQRGAELFEVVAGAPIWVGRDPHQCSIVLEDPRVSAVHASLHVESNELFVTDHSSNNGVLLIANGGAAQSARRAPDGVPARVPTSGQVRFGPIEFTVHTTFVSD
jgi:pSer/pThr/pTyr-binding forkhead associated (FHA) protein